MDEPIYFHTQVKAEDAAKFDDMRLRLLIRKSWLNETEYGQITLDEALAILKDEALYLENRIRFAK